MNLGAYKECFIKGKKVQVEGHYGRIIRGKKPEDFVTLLTTQIVNLSC